MATAWRTLLKQSRSSSSSVGVYCDVGKGYMVFTNIGKEYVSTMDANSDRMRNVYANLVRKANEGALELSGLNVLSAGSSKTPRIVHVCDSVSDGFSVMMKEKAAKVLSSFPEVLRVIEDRQNTLHTTHTPDFLGLTSGQFWPRSQFGKDVIVGVIDTGVWPESKSFSDQGMGPIPSQWKGICEEGIGFTSANCNKKLIGARYIYQMHEEKEGPLDRSKYSLSPRDTEGHGIHVASTAVGSPVGQASLNRRGKPAHGMAFKARVAVYKVVWGTCCGSDLTAAYAAAVKDGVDVISLPLGAGPQLLIDEANWIGAFWALRKGIFVANSAGNLGPRKGTVANIAPWVMTVGAIIVDRAILGNVKLGNGVILRSISWTSSHWGRAKGPLILASDEKKLGADPT